MLRHVLLPSLVLLALLLVAAPASAHERVEVGEGKYQLVVGWTSEPPYVGQINGLDLTVNRFVEGEATADGHGGEARPTEPVDGLLDSLTVTYEIAGQTYEPVDWRGRFGTPGGYTGDITPTREGQYTIHIVGDIDGTPIDVRVKPATVESYKPTMFPEEDLTPEETSTRIAELEAQLATLQARLDALEAKTQTQATQPADMTPQGQNGVPALAPALAVAAVALVALARRQR